MKSTSENDTHEKVFISADELSELQQVKLERDNVYAQLGHIAHQRMDLDAQESALKDRLSENVRSMTHIQNRLVRKYDIPQTAVIEINTGEIVVN